MSGLCMAFFAELTNTLVAKTGETKRELDIIKLKDLEISNKAAVVATEDYLHADKYVIHLEKLIEPEHQEKLRQTFGDEWLTVVNGMYRKIEREVQDDMMRKLSALNFTDGDKDE